MTYHYIINKKTLSGQIKDYKIGICSFFAKHAALRRKSKDWLARNHDNGMVVEFTTTCAISAYHH
jgi:hypothetical protein